MTDLELTPVLFSCSFFNYYFCLFLFFLPHVVNKDFHFITQPNKTIIHEQQFWADMYRITVCFSHFNLAGVSRKLLAR